MVNVHWTLFRVFFSLVSPISVPKRKPPSSLLVTVAVIGCLAVLFFVLKWGAVEKTTLYMLFKQCIVQRQYFDTPWIGNITDCENLDWFLCSTLDKRSIREGCAWPIIECTDDHVKVFLSAFPEDFQESFWYLLETHCTQKRNSAISFPFNK